MAVYFPRKHFQTSGRQEVANLDVRSYFEQASMDNAPSWLSNPEVPTAAEVLGSDTPDDYVCLNPNVIDGPWESKEQYIEAHYKLLREDSVAPLRDAVGTVRSNPSMNDGGDISIYENVSLTHPKPL
jgi:helicase required for RNAi-mediated heterochromatin assembly 1